MHCSNFAKMALFDLAQISVSFYPREFFFLREQQLHSRIKTHLNLFPKYPEMIVFFH